MKELYSLLFSVDNTNKEQNYVMDIDDITNLKSEKNRKVKSYLDRAVISPREKIVGELINMIRTKKL